MKRRWRPRFSLRTLLLGVLFVGACGGLWRRWDAWCEWLTLLEHPDYVDAVTVSPDGRRCATGCWDGRVRVWDPYAGRCLAVLEGHTDVITDLLWTVDGARLISSSFDGTTRTWDATTYQPIGEPVKHPHHVWTVEQSLDGKVLATACADGKARLYSGDHPDQPVICQDGTWSMGFAALSPDGRRVLIGGGGTLQTPKVMDGTTGQVLFSLQENQDTKNYATYSRDGSLVATAQGEGALSIWDAQTGASRMKLFAEKALVWVGFGWDGQRVFGTDTAGTVHVWDLRTGACLARLEGHAGKRARIGPDDAWLLTSQTYIRTAIFYARRRPEPWWGIAWLPEFWVALLSGGALLGLAVRTRPRRSDST